MPPPLTAGVGVGGWHLGRVGSAERAWGPENRRLGRWRRRRLRRPWRRFAVTATFQGSDESGESWRAWRTARMVRRCASCFASRPGRRPRRRRVSLAGSNSPAALGLSRLQELQGDAGALRGARGDGELGGAGPVEPSSSAVLQAIHAQDRELLSDKQRVAARLQAASEQGKLQARQRQERENIETRLFILNEEVDDLESEIAESNRAELKERDRMGRIDAGVAKLDEKVKEFMEMIKQKKHALACERATHEEKCRLIAHDRERLNEKLAMTRRTIESLSQ